MKHLTSPVRFEILCILVLLALGPRSSVAQTPAVTITPAVVEVGSPVLIRVDAPSSARVNGDWVGHKLQFFRGREKQAWYALCGIDVEAAAGLSTLKITVHTADGAEFAVTRSVEIQPAHYSTGALTVPPRFVRPSPEALKQIEAESHLKARVFAASADQPLWESSFRAPVAAAPTDSFGTRRIFDGKLESIHRGMDFRAAVGTPVRAANSGVVVLARRLYFEGNCVIIDHGLGLYSISMHFSRIDVQEGQHVAAGEQLGLSGATGRVTGPHLHWAIRWQNTYLDPGKLLKLDLEGLR